LRQVPSPIFTLPDRVAQTLRLTTYFPAFLRCDTPPILLSPVSGQIIFPSAYHAQCPRRHRITLISIPEARLFFIPAGHFVRKPGHFSALEYFSRGLSRPIDLAQTSSVFPYPSPPRARLCCDAGLEPFYHRRRIECLFSFSPEGKWSPFASWAGLLRFISPGSPPTPTPRALSQLSSKTFRPIRALSFFFLSALRRSFASLLIFLKRSDYANI